MAQQPLPLWATPAELGLRQLDATPHGLTSDAARQRLAQHGANRLTPRRRSNALGLRWWCAAHAAHGTTGTGARRLPAR
jgi:hypothetical protein